VDIESLEKLVGTPRDNAMLRLTLARLLTEKGRLTEAESQLQGAVELNAAYTAAWKELGRVRKLAENPDGAAEAWQKGIEVARENGDIQAEKEMTVFLKRLNKP